MSNTQLIIPKKLKAGFNLRGDTYSGKLAYIIYHDGKIWRKEKSWESWSAKEITYTPYYSKSNPVINPNWDKVKPIEFDNEPTSGFVLNKKVGGGRSDWNHRATYCRVFDPRGFEFEISIPNLLFILQETNSIKGKGLEGEFVYSWDGKDLVLLPCDSIDYQKSQEFTKLQTQKISAKTLIVGATYLTKKQQNVVYLGKLDYYDHKITYSEDSKIEGIGYYARRTVASNTKSYSQVAKKMFTFYNIDTQSLVFQKSVDFLGACVDDKCSINYAEYLEFYENSYEGNRIGDISFEKLTVDDFELNTNCWSFKDRDYYWYVYGVKENPLIIREMYCCRNIRINENGLVYCPDLYYNSQDKWEISNTPKCFSLTETRMGNSITRAEDCPKYNSLQELIDQENLSKLVVISASGKKINKHDIR